MLNAKQHAREAEIVAQAGRPKAITIATNMAGRGTDIVLGGSIEPQLLAIRDDEALRTTDRDARDRTAARANGRCCTIEVVAAGGLHIIGTERHESRRIDNQLRGRSGRQGDPGSSRFYLSLEDPLLRIFGGERPRAIMQRLKMPEGEPIEHPIVNRSIAKAQNRVEIAQLRHPQATARIRRRRQRPAARHLPAAQRAAGDRRHRRDDPHMIAGLIEDTVRRYVPPESVEEQWDVPALEAALASRVPAAGAGRRVAEERAGAHRRHAARAAARAAATQQYAPKVAQVGAELIRQFERNLMLQTLDQHWREHLAALDHLRQGIHLRGYAQKNPKQEYKRESFELFSDMLDRIKQDVVKIVLTVQVRAEEDVQAVEEAPAVVQRAVPACRLR